MENRQSAVQLSREQKQFNELIVSIKEKRKNVMELENQIALICNRPKEISDIRNISTQMQAAIKGIVKTENEIESLEKKKTKLAKNLSMTQTETPEDVNTISPPVYRK